MGIGTDQLLPDQAKLGVADEDFAKWKFAFINNLRTPDYLEDDDIVASRFTRQSSMHGGTQEVCRRELLLPVVDGFARAGPCWMLTVCDMWDCSCRCRIWAWSMQTRGRGYGTTTTEATRSTSGQ